MTLPARFQPAKLHQVENALPAEVGGLIGKVLYERRDRFARAGDDLGEKDWFWYWPESERLLADQLKELRVAILEQIPEVCSKFGIEPFEPKMVSMEPRLYHHGSLRDWHDEVSAEGASETEPFLCVYYWMQSSPALFSGGEVEFLAGDVVAPRNNLLVFTDGHQMRKVRPVECWSSHVLHGSWSIVTWIGK